MDCIYVDLPNGLDNEYHYIDAEPVMHAKWEKLGNRHLCSYCNEWALLDEDDDMELQEVLSECCPHCGARMMDEEKE